MNRFNTISSHGRQQHDQRRAPPDVSADILWLRVGFSRRFDAAGVAHWHRCLHSFLSGSGLTAAIALERIAIFPVGAAITSFDRGLVIGWLTGQPEVVFVHIDRCTARDHATIANTGRPHGQDA